MNQFQLQQHHRQMSSLPGGHSGLLWEMSPSLLLFPCSSKVGLEVAQEVLLPSSSICRSRHRWLVSPSHPWRQTGRTPLQQKQPSFAPPLNWPTEDWENISVTCSHHEEKYPFAKVWLCDDCGWPIFFHEQVRSSKPTKYGMWHFGQERRQFAASQGSR